MHKSGRRDYFGDKYLESIDDEATGKHQTLFNMRLTGEEDIEYGVNDILREMENEDFIDIGFADQIGPESGYYSDDDDENWSDPLGGD